MLLSDSQKGEGRTSEILGVLCLHRGVVTAIEGVALSGGRPQAFLLFQSSSRVGRAIKSGHYKDGRATTARGRRKGVDTTLVARVHLPVIQEVGAERVR